MKVMNKYTLTKNNLTKIYSKLTLSFKICQKNYKFANKFKNWSNYFFFRVEITIGKIMNQSIKLLSSQSFFLKLHPFRVFHFS